MKAEIYFWRIVLFIFNIFHSRRRCRIIFLFRYIITIDRTNITDLMIVISRAIKLDGIYYNRYELYYKYFENVYK